MDFDPAGASVAVEVDGTAYPMTWDGTAVPVGTAWTRSAHTDAFFAGSARTPGPDVQLAVGSHPAQVLISKADGEVIAVAADRLDVF